MGFTSEFFHIVFFILYYDNRLIERYIFFYLYGSLGYGFFRFFGAWGEIFRGFPVNDKEIDRFEDRGDRPGKTVEKEKWGKGPEMTENGVDPDDAENAGPQDHEDCRDHGFAEPARGGDGAVHNTETM